MTIEDTIVGYKGVLYDNKYYFIEEIKKIAKIIVKMSKF